MRIHGSLLCTAIAIGACGYPDSDEVFGAPNASSMTTTSGASTSSHDGAGAAGGAGGATPGAGGATPGAGAASSSTSGGAAGADCDVDRDGAIATGDCGGNDCDDTNSDVHPGQSAFFASPAPNGTFDYDCDDVEQKQFAQVKCTGVVSCGGNEGAEGLEHDAPCGESVSLGKCTGIPCTFVASSRQVQSCH